MNDNALMKSWLTAKKALAKAKEEELRLRNLILAQLLADNESKTVIFGGMKVKAAYRVNYTVDDVELRIIMPDLSPEELATIKWKPSLLLSGYHKLPNSSKLHSAITAKPGQHSLSIL